MPKNKELIKANRKLYIDILECSKCADCDEDDIRVLVFDHVKGDKKDGVATLIKNGYSWATIEAEMTKCEIVCHNCHAIRTHKDSNSYLHKHYEKAIQSCI